MPFSRTDYTCAFQCGFAGSFEIVSAHEANCALNPQNFRQMPLHSSPLHASRTTPGKEPGCPKPAKQIQGSSLSSDVSTYRQALSSTHSIDTPTNILEISNQPEPQNYRRVPLHASSGFGQFEKAGPQTPPRKEPEHHFPIARSFAVPGLKNQQGNAVPGAIKMQKQICEFCKKLIPPSTPEAKTAHEQVEAGVGEPLCKEKCKSGAVRCARVQILGLGRAMSDSIAFFPCYSCLARSLV